MAALTIAVIVVIAIGLVNLFSGDDPPPPDVEVARAAVGQNDALQRQNYPDFLLYTCPEQQGTEAEVIGAQRESVDEKGERYVDDVTDVRIDGDRATATVTYHFDKTPDNKIPVEVTFVRVDGGWKVCSPAAG
ncbi:lumazine-binding protein [Mycolicibacterium phlei]|jgi:hypothetical protein